MEITRRKARIVIEMEFDSLSASGMKADLEDFSGQIERHIATRTKGPFTGCGMQVTSVRPEVTSRKKQGLQ